jgi:hypothetical protein
MASIADLVSRLKKEAFIQAAESPFVTDADALLKTIIEEALTEHNSFYTIASLPAREVCLVMLLARIGVCTVRAQKLAADGNVSGTGGYGTDRNTPYYKTMALITSLRQQYMMKCTSLGIFVNDDKPMGTVHVSHLKVRDSRTDIILPSRTNVAPVPVLFTANLTATEIVFGWNIPEVEDFAGFFLCFVVSPIGQTPIPVHMPWNLKPGAEVPFLNDDAIIVPLPDMRTARYCKLLNVDTAAYRYNTILAVRTLAGNYTLSNTVNAPLTVEEEQQLPPETLVNKATPVWNDELQRYQRIWLSGPANAPEIQFGSPEV